MFFREIMLLYMCALLHFTGIECVIVIKPENVAAVSGESVALHCASDVSKGNIVWSTTDPGSSRKEQIYNTNVLASRFSSYISVSDREDGNCSLNINASFTAAKRYICTEADNGLEASAELIVLEGGLQCNSTNGSAHISCFTVYAGNWAPVVKCYQWKPDVGLIVLQRNLTSTVDNNVTTRTWNYTSKDELFPIFCETAFEESGRPPETSATNIPKCFNQTFVYNGTSVPCSGTTSNSSSAGCPECSTGATPCPVTTAASCTECPTGATTYHVTTAASCTECPTGATPCPATTTAKCSECPTGATPCPMITAAKCPEYPTGATPCPTTTTAKCPEYPTGATPCPTTTTAKCPECPTGATPCPTTTTAKCPECPTGATPCPTATTAKCPECPTGATPCPTTTTVKCPECPTGATAYPVVATAKCPECPTVATAYSVITPAKYSECPTSTAKKCPECPTSAAEKCRRCLAGFNNAENNVAVNVNYPARGPARKVVPANKSPRRPVVGLPKELSAVESPATAAECPVGACCIASLVVICVLVLAMTGYAVYKIWKSKKTVQKKKPKSPEVVVEFEIPNPRRERKGSSQA